MTLGKMNAQDQHQLQLHGALAYLGYRTDRIVEYKPHEVSLNYTKAVEYCRNAGGDIAQPVDKDDLFYGPQCMVSCFCVTLFHHFSPQCQFS